MIKKKWIISFISLIILISVSGYVFSEKTDEQPKVDIVLKNSKSQYWDFIKAGMKKSLANTGVQGKIYIPQKDDENQLKILQQVLKEKPDALVVSLTNPTAAEPILKKFKQEHIPVLLIDTETEWADQTSFIGTDNHMLGQKAGELLTSMLQPGDKVALISQFAYHSVYTDRIKGAKETLTAAGIEVAAEKVIPPKKYSMKTIMMGILHDNPNLKGIYAVNDDLALKVLNYSKEKGLNLTVIGSDGSIQMINEIQNGLIKSTIAQNPYDIGYISMENAAKLLHGDTIERKINIDVDIITKDNAKSKKEFLERILRE